MKTEKKPTKQHIINIGYQLIAEKGFTRVGLTEILKTVAVPKGSFYHYFNSKEQFGEAIIDHYFSDYLSRLDTYFRPNEEQTAYQQLIAYWQLWAAHHSDNATQQRCLVVKLSAEVADQSICKQDENETATLLYSMWLGASLLSILHRDNPLLTQTLKQTTQLLTPTPS